MVAEAIAVMLFAFLLFLVFPEIGLIAKWSEPIAIVLDQKTREVTFQRVKKRKNGVLYTEKIAAIETGKSFNNRTGLFKIASRKLYILQKNKPTTLDIVDGKFVYGEINQEEFHAAIESDIIVKFLRGNKFDWKIMVIIVLGLVSLILAVTSAV